MARAMPGVDVQRVAVSDAVLEVERRGSGEPIALIQTALTADEFRPLAVQRRLQDRYQLILYHRRGYAGSSPVVGPGSIPRDALDCQELLAALGVERAHVVGVSYSAAVALQLAATAPACVHTLTLIEPPPVHTPSRDQFIAAIDELLENYRRLGAATTLDRFLTRVIGPDWRSDLERHIPGGVAQSERDVGTFFETDLPALLDWRFGPIEAGRIDKPVVYVGGSRSGPWFDEVRDLIMTWLPQTQDVEVVGADHSLAITHPVQIAAAMESFLHRHPITA
jgi:pimeloyl-ACP methyl ester carboxylesterase